MYYRGCINCAWAKLSKAFLGLVAVLCLEEAHSHISMPDVYSLPWKYQGQNTEYLSSSFGIMFHLKLYSNFPDKDLQWLLIPGAGMHPNLSRSDYS